MASVFISYNWNDKPFAIKLAHKLRENGVEVWIDEDGLKIGDSLTQKIPTAIKSNDYVAAIISKSSVSSSWVQKELALAMSHEITDRSVKVLPILIDQNCMIPEAIEDKLYADFSNNKNYEKSFSKLLEAIGITLTKVGSDIQFTAYDNGVVEDCITGLEWVAGPDEDTTWDEAVAWVESLSVDGGDWRMPAPEELKSLYEKNKGIRNMTGLLKTTGYFVWIAEHKDWAFDFGFGDANWGTRKHSDDCRVFAVRFRKDRTM